MLFLRSVYMIATAASIIFTSASPVQELGVNLRSLDTDAAPGALLLRRRVGSLDDVEARSTLQPLGDVLRSAQNQLTIVKDKVEPLGQDGKEPLDINTIRLHIGVICDILDSVYEDAKLLEGKSINVILGGCTGLDIANLLCAVLTLIVNILLTLIKCAGPGSSAIVIGIIGDIVSVVLCKVLTLVLSLVGGLLGLLLPLLLEVGIIGGLSGGLTQCGLGSVLKLLTESH